MLKHRQEGLRCLHGCAIVLTAAGLYVFWSALVSWTGWIKFAEPARISTYLLGVLAATLWIARGLKGCQARLGNLGWWEATRIARHQLTCIVAVLFTIAFATKDVGVSRVFLCGYVVLMAPTLVLANRIFPRLIVRWFFHGAVMRTVLVAPDADIEDLAEWIKSREHLGIQVIGWVGSGHPTTTTLPLLGPLSELRRVVIEHDVSQVVVSQSAYEPRQAHEIARCVEDAGCRVRFYTNSRRYFGSLPVSIEHEGDYTFVMLAAEPLENPANRAIKRTLDIVVSLPVVLFVLPPLVAMVALMQRLQSPGPVFHRQYRSGLNRRKFLIFKFRTMHVQGTAQSMAKQAQREDSRVYRFGRFLRRSSLDEIPQFLNVLWGDMSVSGPRPHLIEHDEQFAKIVNSYYTRHFVKPGITGLAQSKGFRGEISEVSLLHKRIGYDMMYIRRWSLLLDLQILVETVRQVFKPPRSAY
ncbi:exopolysaccharide biosynthesis polyprenyl glycosylphosphotransferase [Opitutus terrae]|uniref:Exopolysaccharide biosynthesis polyprenyl glycosylphosphotransferase n=1 Tax=Opitutus terrae (strain DSM 11246 / JCM 15787 / PB90-1) TaxID=452637 RepID=B1ZT65_OPITP|nr:exopolysaccharide biosynthesis polyprenyl glycosylphosphotransferase [Opitutus terrae]ACB76519.1 exopolysaccharide biosynthesis polyprenyl glycosylphosphotransferase [Opitutus terrae PB90-1]